MRAIIDIESADSSGRCFLTWAPVKATVRLEDADRNVPAHRVKLRNSGSNGGGRLVLSRSFTQSDDAELSLPIASDGSPQTIWVAGAFLSPSTDYGDAAIEAVTDAGEVIGSRNAMVRVRKDATKLTPAERDRFLEALAALNDAGAGPFRAFRDMHVRESSLEAHGAAGFLPWHRAYVLDLERSLQAIDPTVALPYWRFDEAAPSIFAAEFLGSPSSEPGAPDIVVFPPGHPLEFWTTDGMIGISRRPRWDTTQPPTTPATLPGGSIPAVLSEQDTFALGGAGALYAAFRQMEASPHGAAHVRFDGPINSVPTAARDPLFFLLHTNVDRLWARWQWLNRRSNADDPSSYSVFGSTRPDGGGNIGHRLGDTMWPWNQDRNPPRPSFVPPRPGFPPSPFATMPGTPSPRVGDMIDFHGIYSGRSLGFSYDDVPFELETVEAVA
ncbi:MULTISPECIES: tyrosinase family protein [unclassified Mesorhizobium]|uniref:tyrosinase family protein n=1 Tax=unclassified Mesorhizobium TaxID=325217 RepID=UPI001AED3E4E|nr:MULTISPECIES: tyrosinase family protein [unclassified Mesorhizobium]